MSMDNYIKITEFEPGTWFENSPSFVVANCCASSDRTLSFRVFGSLNNAENFAHSRPSEYGLQYDLLPSKK